MGLFKRGKSWYGYWRDQNGRQVRRVLFADNDASLMRVAHAIDQLDGRSARKLMGSVPEALADVAGLVAMPMPKSVVYFLVVAGEVVYVGQSGRPVARLGDHLDAVEIDQVFFVEVPPEQREAVEENWIERLQPPCNIKGLEHRRHRGQLSPSQAFPSATPAADVGSGRSGVACRA